MTDTDSLAGPDIVDVEAGAAAVAWARLTFAEIAAHQRSAIARVDAAMERADVPTDGLRLTFSRAPEGGTLDIAPGRMIADADTALDDVTIEIIPAGRAAHLTFYGPYTGLAEAWRELGRWLVHEGLQPGSLCWEVYTDSGKPVTDLYIMLA